MSRSIRTVITTAAIAGLALTGCASDSDVPAFDDIEAQMWESMSASEAMGMTGTLPDAMAEDAAIIEDMLGGSLSELEIYGALDGSATAIRLGEDQEPIMAFFDDDVYVSMDMMLQTMGSMLPEDQLNQMTTEFAGKYADISEGFDATNEGINMADLLDQMRSAAESNQTDDVTGFNFGDLNQEGAYMQLDSETEDTGWFYSADSEDENAIMNGESEQYIAVITDRDAPRLEKIRNGETRMEFTWDDEVEIPQRPSDDQVVTEQDVMTMTSGQ